MGKIRNTDQSAHNLASEVTGDVKCFRLSSSRAIRKLVERRIKSWAQRRARNSARYHVIFEKREGGHCIFCQVEVSIGNAVLRATESAEGITQAFSRALGYLDIQVAVAHQTR